LKDQGPYLGLGEEPTLETLTKALHLSIDEEALCLEVKKKSGTKGISRKVLEAKAQTLLAKKEWKVFNAILALLIYGVVLFPNIDDFVDLAAIGVFVSGNPVDTLLADLHLSLYDRHENERGGTISCCTPLMQVWLTSHLPKKGTFLENPANLKWSQRMTTLTEKDISWYSRELDGTEVILSCGNFPNVPLMGTKGCINYNHVLSLRQLGYPMEDEPDDRLLEGFILKKGMENPALLRKIRRAWGQVHKKKLEKKNCVAKPLYTRWVKERVKVMKLPFDVMTPVGPPSPEPITTIPIEEAQEMRASIMELQKSNEEWESKYLQAIGKVARLERDQEHQNEVLQESGKRFRESEEKRWKIKDGLLSANDNLIAKDEEIERLKYSYGEVKKFGKKAFEAQRKWRVKNQEQEAKTQEVKGQLHLEILRSQELESLYLQEKAKRECLQSGIQDFLDQHVKAHVDQIARLNGELEDKSAELARRGVILGFVWDDALKLKENFSKLAAFSNEVIAQIPEKLAHAEVALSYYNIPEDIKEFMNYCKGILEFYKQAVDIAKKRLAE
jgi:muconolactone delta-isomerase